MESTILITYQVQLTLMELLFTMIKKHAQRVPITIDGIMYMLAINSIYYLY